MLEPDPNFPSWQARKHAAELSCKCAACGAGRDDTWLELYHQPDRHYWLCVDGTACFNRRMTTARAEASLPDAQIAAIVDAWCDDWAEADTRELWRTWM